MFLGDMDQAVPVRTWCRGMLKATWSEEKQTWLLNGVKVTL